MRLAILGATGSVGRELVAQALEAGHDVTALVNSTPKPGEIDARVTIIPGDATDAASVNRTVAGNDAVLSALGHGKRSPDNILAIATSNVLAAMHDHKIRRLVVLASSTVCDPQDRPGLNYRLVRLVLPIIMRRETRDHRAQARLIENSGVEWTIVRGALQFTDGPHTGHYRVGPISHESSWRISRADLADFMLAAVTNGRFVRSLPLVSQ